MSVQKPMMPQAGEKYVPFRPIEIKDRQWPNKVITKPPIWCAVDLRKMRGSGWSAVTPTQGSVT